MRSSVAAESRIAANGTRGEEAINNNKLPTNNGHQHFLLLVSCFSLPLVLAQYFTSRCNRSFGVWCVSIAFRRVISRRIGPSSFGRTLGPRAQLRIRPARQNSRQKCARVAAAKCQVRARCQRIQRINKTFHFKVLRSQQDAERMLQSNETKNLFTHTAQRSLCLAGSELFRADGEMLLFICWAKLKAEIDFASAHFLCPSSRCERSRINNLSIDFRVKRFRRR